MSFKKNRGKLKIMLSKNLFVFTDGGARGNPGPAAIGVVIKDNRGKFLAKIAKKIGVATNNVAEYTAVIEALKWVQKNYPIIKLSNYPITLFSDSSLIVNQLKGFYKIKDKKLKDLAIKVKNLEKEIPAKINYFLISREKNWQADKLVNHS